MEVTTPRLWIRTLRESDWPAMGRLFRDFEASPYSIYDGPFPDTEAGVRELTWKFASTGLFFAVFQKEQQDMMGYVCFHKGPAGYDLGYCFHSDYQGRGFALESCRAMMQVFRQRGVEKFTAGTALKNLPSCRLLEKLGFACESTEELSFHRDSEGNPISFTGGNFIFRG